MIKVLFRCNVCGWPKGTIITTDRTTEVECDNCKLWGTMEEKTDENSEYILSRSITTKAQSQLSLALTGFDTFLQNTDPIDQKQERKYTVEEIKAYASNWLKNGLSTDGKDSIPDNIRLLAFIHYMDADDRDNIENFLTRRKK